MFSKLKSVIKTKEVTFSCYKEDFNVIPPPVPAKNILPQWYKELPAKINKENKLNSSTIRRCFPFQDALCAGWIIPLCADVEITTNKDGSVFETKSNFYRTMVESHGVKQVEGHPSLPFHPLKWLNYWAIKMPPGYSMLFVPPLNRYESRFECISGVVDSEYMGANDEALEFINFPFFFKIPNYTGIIAAGTSLVQAIPIKRDNILASSKTIKTRILSKKDLDLIEHTRKRRKVRESLYRDLLRQPK